VFRNGRMLRRLVCLGGVALFLASCSPSATQITQSQRLQREKTACHLIGAPPKLPKPTHGTFFVMAVKTSLISVLGNSDNFRLEAVGHNLETAGTEESKSGSAAGMVRALDKGVAVCRHLGLSTTSK
jgi:hypothetical protein